VLEMAAVSVQAIEGRYGGIDSLSASPMSARRPRRTVGFDSPTPSLRSNISPSGSPLAGVSPSRSPPRDAGGIIVQGMIGKSQRPAGVSNLSFPATARQPSPQAQSEVEPDAAYAMGRSEQEAVDSVDSVDSESDPEYFSDEGSRTSSRPTSPARGGRRGATTPAHGSTYATPNLTPRESRDNTPSRPRGTGGSRGATPTRGCGDRRDSFQSVQSFQSTRRASSGSFGSAAQVRRGSKGSADGEFFDCDNIDTECIQPAGPAGEAKLHGT